MSSTNTLPQGTHYIHLILPSIKIYYKLNILLTSISTTNNDEKHFIVIAVEQNNQKRHFLGVTFDELSKLLHTLEPPKRTLHEILCQNNFCKLYFDFDINIKNSLSFNIQESLLILQNLFHYAISSCTNQHTHHSSSIADHFLLLSASTESKHSYHLIYTNTVVRFESQQTIFKFITVILEHCSNFILSHSCHQKFLKVLNTHEVKNLNNYFIRLQNVLTHNDFCNCTVPATNITCNDFQKLLFKNSEGFYQWVFDLQVYNKNQQFRLYKATKFGKDNPLLPTSHFPFNERTEQHDSSFSNITNYNSILSHALISYTINNTNLLIVSCNENKWLLINQHRNQIFHLATTSIFTSLPISVKSTFKNHQETTTTRINTTEIPIKQIKFESFILDLITKTYHTKGYVQSTQQDTKNQSLLFFNIGGNFRFCERLQRHHKSNQTCIIIDTITHKYQIKCKDPECKNFKPPWKEISQFRE